jgi:hypothetical protein
VRYSCLSNVVNWSFTANLTVLLHWTSYTVEFSEGKQNLFFSLSLPSHFRACYGKTFPTWWGDRCYWISSFWGCSWITFNVVLWLSVSRALRKLILICLCSCDLLNLQGTYSWPNWRIHPSWAGLRNRAGGFQLSLEGKDCRTTFNGTSSGSYSMKLLAGMSCNKVLWISVKHELIFSYDRSISKDLEPNHWNGGFKQSTTSNKPQVIYSVWSRQQRTWLWDGYTAASYDL